MQVGFSELQSTHCNQRHSQYLLWGIKLDFIFAGVYDLIFDVSMKNCTSKFPSIVAEFQK